MRKVFLIFLLPFTMILQCRGQENSPLTQLQRDFFEALFHLDIAHAESLLTEIENTDTTEGIIAKTQLLWWKNISTGKPIKPLLRYIEEITNSYPEMPIALSMHLNSMRLRIHTTEKNYLRAWKEWKIFEDSLEECTQICDHDTELFIRGVYHCMKAELQRRMPLLINDSVSSYKNMETGISKLEACSKSSNVVIRYESHYFLMRVYAELHEECLSSIDHSSCLVDTFPENYIFCYYHKNYLLKVERKKEASMAVVKCLEALESSSLIPDQKRYGRILLIRGNY